ncbi:hypothetical protein C2W62_16250 [Candidatus Entotheonella serta]|nr:hypothetical protein C2W62_16250 [Candidatus Entotheonella serta]
MPDADHGVDLTINAVQSNLTQQSLIRFDHLFGSEPGQIPWGSTIVSAGLSVHVTRGAGPSASIALHRMLISWHDTDNWQTLDSGIQTDDYEALMIADSVLVDPVSETAVGFASPDLTATVQAWSNGEPNYGWVMLNDQSRPWHAASSEAVDPYIRPILTVTFMSNTPPTADAGGPYEIAEGDTITLNASASSNPDGDPLTYRWDLDNNLEYGDVIGTSPILDWETLQTFGIDDGKATYAISVQVDDGQGGTHTASTSITVANTAPTLSTTGDSTATAGTSYTLELNADDPGDDIITEWSINWGDGDIDTLTGNPPSASHIYTRAGFTFQITASATDEDGTFLQNEILITANPVSFVASATGGLDGSTGLAFGPDGHLYIASHHTHNVLRVDGLTGALIDAFVPAGDGGLAGPGSFTFGPDGNLYVASHTDASVLRYEGTPGAFIDVFIPSGNHLSRPEHIVFGPDDNLYVADDTGNTVMRFDGQTGAFIDTFVTSTGSLDRPKGIAFGPDGNFYVSSYNTDNVLRYDGLSGLFMDEYVASATGGLRFPYYFLFIPGQQVTVIGDPSVAISQTDHIASQGEPATPTQLATGDSQRDLGPALIDASGLPNVFALVLTGGGDPPVANPDSYNVDQDTTLIAPVASGILINDFDPESDPLGARSITGPTKGRITLNPIGTVNDLNLTTNSAADRQPAWSPDSAQIAFHTNRAGNDEIYVMDANGDNPTNLTRDVSVDSEPAWSPDGLQIAFRSDRDGNGEIYVMDRDGQNQTNLTSHPDEDARPTWSPDGLQIAFRRSQGGIGEIYAMDNDGQNQINLTNHVADDHHPAWSPDGSKIAFQSKRDGDNEIFVMDANGDNPIQLTFNSVEDALPTWSPNGAKILFKSERDGNPELYAMNPDGSDQARLTENTDNDSFPAWSPDGSQILFQTNRDGNNELYQADILSDGAFSYTPNLGFTGADGFTYVATDGASDSNMAAVTITVNATELSLGMAIWRDRNSTIPQFNEWDGTMFGTEGNTVDVGAYRWMDGAEAPNRDEVIVCGIDGSGNITGLMWDGATWTALSINPLETGFPQTFLHSCDIAYERQSGDAILVWANGNSGTNGLSYSVWDGTAWAAVQSITTPISGSPRHLHLVASPQSNEMILVVSDESSRDYAIVWNGTTWGNSQVLDSSGVGDDRTDIGAAYEHDSGHAMVVYGRNSSDAKYRFWNGSTWSAEGSVASGSAGNIHWVTLDGDPHSDRIVMGILTDDPDVWLNVWDGTKWGTSLTAESTPPNTIFQGVDVAFEGLSGEALAVYAQGSTSKWQYRTWTSAGGWSGASNSVSISNTPNTITLEPDPSTDDIMLAIQDNNSQLNYVRWDGTSSAWESPNLLETDTNETRNQPFVFIWEQAASALPNTSPILDPAATPALSNTNEDAGAPSGVVGTLITSLIDFPGGGGLDNVTDPDTGALTGIAVTDADTASGNWHYSIDNGAIWNPLGPVANINARLLAADANTRIYFEPHPDDNGPLSPAITFRAWDQTEGSNGTIANTGTGGGTSTFSAATDTADLMVIAVNDPLTATIVLTDYPVSENSNLSLHGTGLSINDLDAGTNTIRVTIFVVTKTLSVIPGTTGVSITGSGTSSVTLEGNLNQLRAISTN